MFFSLKALVCSADCLRPYTVVSDEARAFPDYGWRELFPLAWLQPAVFPLALDIFGQNGLMHARTLTARLTVCARLYAFVAYACSHTCLLMIYRVIARIARDPKRTRCTQVGPA